LLFRCKRPVQLTVDMVTHAPPTVGNVGKHYVSTISSMSTDVSGEDDYELEVQTSHLLS